MEVAINDKILQIDDINCYKYIINKKNLLNNFTHQTIRIKNILKVILNEILVHEKCVNIVKNLVSNKEEENIKELVEILKYEEDKEYEESCEKFKNSKDLASKDIGKSKYFEAKESSSCVVAIHGFLQLQKRWKN